MRMTFLKHFRAAAALLALTLAFAVNCSVLAAEHNLSGTWKASFTTQNGQTIESTLKLKQDGEKLSGVVIGRNGNERPLDEITLTGDQLSLKFTRERNGEKVIVKVAAKVSGDELKGKLESNYGGENRTADWEATRVKETADNDPASSKVVSGKWDYDIDLNGNTLNLVLTLKQDGEKLSGKVSVGDFDLPISEGKIAGDAISFTVVVDRDDLKFTSKYKGTVAGDTIKGKIHSDRNGQDHEYDWNATREKAATASNATGLWKWVLVTENGDSHDLSLKLKQEGDKLSGVVILGDNEIPISDGLVKDNEVTLKVTRERDGKTQVSKFKGTLDGDSIKGKIDSDWSGEMRNYAWNAKRSG
jgi:hypothetical protein